MSLRSAKRWVAIGVLSLAATGLGACGNDDADPEAATTTTKAEGPKGTASVSIEMRDYSYAVSGPLTASDHATLEVRNTGTEFHMIAFGRMKEGKKISDVIEALQSEGPPGGEGEGGEGEGTTTTAAAPSTTAAGAGGQDEGGNPMADVFATEEGEGSTLLSPGASQKLTLPTLKEAGEYALICFLPTEGEGAPHFTKGMVGQLTVTDDGDTATEPTPTAEYAITKGKLSGPTALKAGKNVIKADPEDGPHDFVVARMKPGKTFKDLDTYITDIFESEKPPAKGAAANSPGTILAGAFESGEDPVVIELDLEPGTYLIACVKVDNDDDEDDKNDFDHFVKEQLTVKVT